MNQNSTQIKLLNQISNLESSITNIETQLRCLSHDLAYRSISRSTFDARKNQLEQAKNKIRGSIDFLNVFYEKSKRIDANEFVGT